MSISDQALRTRLSLLTQREVEAHDTLIRLAQRLAHLKPPSVDRVFERWDMLHMVEGPEEQQFFRQWLKRVTEER